MGSFFLDPSASCTYLAYNFETLCALSQGSLFFSRRSPILCLWIDSITRVVDFKWKLFLYSPFRKGFHLNALFPPRVRQSPAQPSPGRHYEYMYRKQCRYFTIFMLPSDSQLGCCRRCIKPFQLHNDMLSDTKLCCECKNNTFSTFQYFPLSLSLRLLRCFLIQLVFAFKSTKCLYLLSYTIVM